MCGLCTVTIGPMMKRSLPLSGVRRLPSTAPGKCSRREMAGPHTDEALWLKFVNPEEAEDEHYEVYEQILTYLRRMESDGIM